MVIYSEFSHEKWQFSIAMLVYQRVNQQNIQIYPFTQQKLGLNRRTYGDLHT